MVGKRKTDDVEEELADDVKSVKRQRKPISGSLQVLQDSDDEDESMSDEAQDSDFEPSQTIAPIVNGSINGVNHANGNGDHSNGSHISDDLSEDEEEIERTLQESELGIIERITLENFMCHRHFEIKFGPNVNFISGENGSGKSALLVALMVCLGSKAGSTNRGHKLGDLVKADCSAATVTVVLRNRGNEAYRPEEFGPSIVIERKFYKTGSGGGYKIKDHTGKKVVSTRHDDLCLILEQFNIQIENPMAILMQDTSREFLNESSPQRKYDLFLTATQLDQMKKDFNHIHDNIKQIDITLTKKNAVIAEMEKKVAEYNKEYKELQRVVNLEQNVQQLKEKWAWSYVANIEKTIAKLTGVLQEQGSGEADNQAKLANLSNKLNQTSEEIRKLREDNGALTEHINTFEEKKRLVEQKLQEIAREDSKIIAKVTDVNKRIDLTNNRKKRSTQMINEFKRKNAQSVNNQAKFDQIEENKKRITDVEERLVVLGQESEGLKREVADSNKQLHESTKSLQDINYQVGKIDKEIQGLQSSKGDISRVYGEKIPNFLKKIQANARQFRGKLPIGPLGMNIKVRHEKWSSTLETCISKKILKSFIVETHQDGQLLAKMAHESGIHDFEVAVVQKFQDHIYHEIRDDFDPKYLTVFRAIESNIPHVLNYLIDTKRIHTTLLEEDRMKAQQIIYKERPPFLKDAYTLDGDRIYMNGESQAITTGMKIKGTMLQTNVESVIASLQEQKQGLLPELDSRRANEAQIKTRVRQMTQEDSKKTSEISRLNKSIWDIKNEIKNLEDSIIETTDDPTEELQQGIDQMDNEIQEMRNELDAIKQQRAELEGKKKPHQLEMKELDIQRSKIHSQIEANDQRVKQNMQIERDIRQKEGQLLLTSQRQTQQKEKLNAELNAEKQRLTEESAKAEQFCARVPVDDHETPESLSKEINKLNNIIERESAGRRSRSEVYRLCKESQESLNGAIEKRETLKKLSNSIQVHLNARYQSWQKFRAKIARRTALFFNIFLSRKGYTGNIEFNHPEKKLDVHVQLNKMAPASNTAKKPSAPGKGDTKSLSGGEKSFSTVSLLLALWEAMECPFRAMDEFDVFMDEVNRRISIDLLLSKAKENRNRQYIFVTPLPLNSITPSPFIFVHKVRPPVRGQSTIIESVFN